jgi:hypothetical protein
MYLLLLQRSYRMLHQEYEDVSAFFRVFEQQDSSVVLDLSCGSGLMTRKLVSLHSTPSVVSAQCIEYATSSSPVRSTAVCATSHIQCTVHSLRAQADSGV